MYYSSIVILSLIIHFIINYDIMKRSQHKSNIPAQKAYKKFLNCVMWYYITDVLWEVLYYFRLNTLIFIETTIYFIVMAFAVLLWMKYVNQYLGENNHFSLFLKYSGWLFFCLQIIILTLNIFFKIAFWFDENGEYQTSIARILNLLIQAGIFLVIYIHMLVVTGKAKINKKNPHRAVGNFGLVMMIFAILQAIFPLMPFYAAGYLIGTCLLHTFVLEDEKEKRREELEALLQIEHLQEAEISTTRQMAYTDPMTGVKNKMAYLEDVSAIDRRIQSHNIDSIGVAIFDVNGLKEINDTKGHDEGDNYIKDASKIICHIFKHSPVYRIGGDEFATILIGEDYDNITSLISDFNDIIEKNKTEGGIVISCGYSKYHKSDDFDFACIFERADKKMYQRKRDLKKE